jgi:hypothetical protein
VSARTALVILAMLVCVSVASAQPTASDEHPYGLDPYKPSDAALLRDYGDTLVAQTPLTELRKLDPYKPSHAALLRDIGGAMPLWGIVWYPGPVPSSLMPFGPQPLFERPAVRLRHDRHYERSEIEAAPAPPMGAPPESSSMATLRAPETNDGVWIVFAGQKWISAGHSVALEDGKFERAGEYGEFPVYKRVGAVENVIYLPTREGAIAPYRVKP